jgi:hypothetical protein
MQVAQPRKGMNILLIPFVLTIIFLLASIGFGVWAFMGRQDYKNNVDPKIAQAVQIAQQETSTAKDKEFVEKEKFPVKEYKAPQTAGSLYVVYPKTWSGFVTERSEGDELINGYFHPNYVPGVQSGTDFALRVRVLSRTYSEHLKQFEAKAKAGKVKIAPYAAPKLGKGVVGVRIDGEINTGQKDTMVLFPLRDKVIEVSTESAQFLGDFENIVLANLKFSP